MILDYIPIAILILLSTILAVLVIVLGHLFGPKKFTEAKKLNKQLNTLIKNTAKKYSIFEHVIWNEFGW